MRFAKSIPFLIVGAVIDMKKTTMTISDGATTPNTLEIMVGEGNFTYNERRNMEYIKDKGSLDTVRQGDEEPVEVRFDIQWEYLQSETEVNIEEALKQIGAASAWVTSSADLCEPYAVDLIVLYDPDCAPNPTETITVADFRWESLEHDLRGGTIACSGNANVTLATVA